jgi:hypothetical protein
VLCSNLLFLALASRVIVVCSNLVFVALAGLVYRAMGFPPQFFTVLFAIPRVTGYLAHWREQLTDPDLKIVRPQEIYTVRPSHCSSKSTGFESWQRKAVPLFFFYLGSVLCAGGKFTGCVQSPAGRAHLLWVQQKMYYVVGQHDIQVVKMEMASLERSEQDSNLRASASHF